MAHTTVTFPRVIAEHYINILKKIVIVDGVLLFGSFAWGKPTKHSDVDLVVLSRDFSKRDFDQRLDFLTQARDDRSRQIAMDVIGYTPKEFAHIEKESAIMAKAKKDGKWLYRKRTRNCLS